MNGADIDYNETAAAGRRFSTDAVPGVTFSDGTNEYSIEDLFGLLDNGEDIVLNNVPIGWSITAGQQTPTDIPFVDGLRFTSKQESVDEGVYSGVATVLASGANIHSAFAFSIVRYMQDDTPVYEFFSQGVIRFTSPT